MVIDQMTVVSGYVAREPAGTAILFIGAKHPSGTALSKTERIERNRSSGGMKSARRFSKEKSQPGVDWVKMPRVGLVSKAWPWVFAGDPSESVLKSTAIALFGELPREFFERKQRLLHVATFHDDVTYDPRDCRGGGDGDIIFCIRPSLLHDRH